MGRIFTTVESAVTTRRIVRARRIRPTKVAVGEKEHKNKSTTDAPNFHSTEPANNELEDEVGGYVMNYFNVDA